MKRWIIAISIIFALSTQLMVLCQDKPVKKETKLNLESIYKEIQGYYADEKYEQALQLSEETMKKAGFDLVLVRFKYDTLIQLDRLNDALTFIEKVIKKKGELEELISAKYNLFMLKKDYPKALETAKHRDKISKDKSPWVCIDIMHVFLAMHSKEEAMDWLQEAVNRGFISYRMLAGKRYKLLEKEKRFYEIIETIKVSIGLGFPARNFRADTLGGESFHLQQSKGKVVLVMFWATWCPDCHRDMPEIKEAYNLFKDKGFEIVGVSLDTDKELPEKYVAHYGLKWTQIASGKGWQDPVVIRYGVNSIPSYWLIDKNGILRSFGLEGNEMKKAIETLLAETPKK